MKSMISVWMHPNNQKTNKNLVNPAIGYNEKVALETRGIQELVQFYQRDGGKYLSYSESIKNFGKLIMGWENIKEELQLSGVIEVGEVVVGVLDIATCNINLINGRKEIEM